MNQTREVPCIHMEGSPRERGLAHGKAVQSLIVQNVAFYKRLLKLPDDVLRNQAKKFADIIATHWPQFVEEMDGIAEGSGVEREYIYMINARTELLAMGDTVMSECATFFFPQTGLLFENWDWSEPSKDLTVLLSIVLPNGNKILTFTEAGMLAKVGMSSAGFGVAFNYLYPSAKLDGVPIHALLRAVLEANSYTDAEALMKSDAYKGTSGNIMLADASGAATDFELSGANVSTLPVEGSFMTHTNHYLGGNVNDPEAGSGFLNNSFERYTRATNLLSHTEKYDLAAAESLLTERGAGDGMLCRDFIPEEPGHTMGTGTIASIVMDLRGKKMHVALDPQQSDRVFKTYTL